jgi:hypothetical protein
MTAHSHPSHCAEGTYISDGNQFVDASSGWEIAPSDDPNISGLCQSIPWSTLGLVFADGSGHSTYNVYHGPCSNFAACSSPFP